MFIQVLQYCKTIVTSKQIWPENLYHCFRWKISNILSNIISSTHRRFFPIKSFFLAPINLIMIILQNNLHILDLPHSKWALVITTLFAILMNLIFELMYVEAFLDFYFSLFRFNRCCADHFIFSNVYNSIILHMSLHLKILLWDVLLESHHLIRRLFLIQ